MSTTAEDALVERIEAMIRATADAPQGDLQALEAARQLGRDVIEELAGVYAEHGPQPVAAALAGSGLTGAAMCGVLLVRELAHVWLLEDDDADDMQDGN